MQIEGATALVTGANRGIGRAIASELRARGAKVYAGVRDPSVELDDGFIPVEIDVTDPAQVAAAAERLSDVSIVVNNAGVSTYTSPLDGDSLDDARREIEVNYFGPLSVSRAFAPVLKANGGGALVNVLSALAWVSYPQIGNYSASKSAAWSLTNALRVMLREQGTLVAGVHVGWVDTDLAAAIDDPKVQPEQVARAVAEGIEAGTEEILVDDTSRQVKSALSDDQNLIYPGVQQGWDATHPVKA